MVAVLTEIYVVEVIVEKHVITEVAVLIGKNAVETIAVILSVLRHREARYGS
jgi:hypothetical protein